jgi:transposase InsO family protein
VLLLSAGGSVVLVELGVVDQRLSAVHEVLDGATVVGVAARYGVSRQTVHRWLRRYARDGVAGLLDGSPVPVTCPHQMPAVVEARIIEMRHDHPGWGPRTIGHQLGREGFDPVPAKTSIYRCLVRHGLITPVARRRKRADYRRWERARAMELWQMDITGGVRLRDGSRPWIVTGIDDYSRFCVSALVVARATAKPTCDALGLAMRTHGVPEAVLTDNGKVFTNRFGRGNGEVLFDRICRENGIRHLLTAPRSPTTTGKVERFHKTLKSECLAGQTFVDLAAAQTAIDTWVIHYNHQRPHQGIGMVAPIRRFELAAVTDREAHAAPPRPPEPELEPTPSCDATRRVNAHGSISFARAQYHAGRWLTGQAVRISIDGELVSIHHRGVLVATHARTHDPAKERAALTRQVSGRKPRKREATRPDHPLAPSADSVTRKVDSAGSISFAAATYSVGSTYRRKQVQVAVVDDHVQIAFEGTVIRTHPIRHDPTRQHGALANPAGRPNRINAA